MFELIKIPGTILENYNSPKIAPQNLSLMCDPDRIVIGLVSLESEFVVA